MPSNIAIITSKKRMFPIRIMTDTSSRLVYCIIYTLVFQWSVSVAYAQSPPYIREGNSTTINTVAIAYDFTSSGSADYYIIAINSNPVQNRNVSQISGTDQFDNLIPGVIYIIAAYSVTQGLYSSGPIATANIGTYPKVPEYQCVPSNTTISIIIYVPSQGIDQYAISCPSCTSPKIDIHKALLQPPSQTVNFMNLQPDNNYNIIITATGISNKVSLVNFDCQTTERAPSSVNSLKASNDLPNAVTLRWQIPSQQNGIIRYYIISYYKEQNAPLSIQTTSLEYTVDGLIAGSTYQFAVSAFTVAQGPASFVNVTTIISAPDVDKLLNPFSESSVSNDKVKLTLSNPFTDKYGVIKFYSILVSLTNNPLPSDSSLATWQQASQNMLQSYIAVYRCNKLFQDGDNCWTGANNRRRRATRNETISITIGEEGCSNSLTDYCNGPLKSSTTYYFAIRAYTTDNLYSDSRFSDPISTGQSTNVPLIIGLVVGIGGAIIIVVIIIIILFFLGIIGGGTYDEIYIPTLTDIYNIGDRPSHKVKIADFASHFEKLSENSNNGFRTEYQRLSDIGKHFQATVGKSTIHKNNRNSSVLPYDMSRVKLTGSVEDDDSADYINASWMPGKSSPREYIVTQTPLDNTFKDFWRMIWENRTSYVIMAATTSQEHYNDKSQTAFFLPSKSKDIHVGNLTISLEQKKDDDEWTVAECKLTIEEASRTLIFLIFHEWKEDSKSLPPVESLVKFVNYFRKRHTWDGHPIVVLCSTGAGPSGVLIALDRLIIDAEQTKSIDVFGTVYETRLHRMQMVNSEDLYIYLHRAMLFAVKNQFSGGHIPWGTYTNGNQSSFKEQI